MTTPGLILAMALTLAGKPAPAGPETAADAVTLRDGKVVLGQVIETAARGNVAVVVRRAWAEENLPELAKRWEDDSAPALKAARKQRRERLEAWKRDRAGTEPTDPITGWIDRELARLDDKDGPEAAPLLVVTLSRANVRGVVRRPKASARLLRLGWRSGFKNVEMLTLDSLKDALDGRGFDLASTEPVSIEHLIPLQTEPEAQWRTRRAATEATYDSGLRFLKIQNLLLPEPAPGQPLGPEVVTTALGDLTKLLTGEPTDATADRFRALSARGKVGAIVTGQDISPDLDGVVVTMTLFVRGPNDRWSPMLTRSATARSGDLKPEDAKALADDPQVDAVFSIVKSLGLGDANGEIKQKSLNVGALARKALSMARTAFEGELANHALGVGGGS